MAQLTVLNPDDSVADTFSISDALALELTKVLQHSKKESLDLALLREIKLRVLSILSKAFALSNIDCFGSLLDVIFRIEKLPNPDSLIIFVSE